MSQIQNLPFFCQTSQKATLFYYLSCMGAILALIMFWCYPEIMPLY